MVFNCHFFIPSKTLVIFRYYWRTHLQFFSFFFFFFDKFTTTISTSLKMTNHLIAIFCKSLAKPIFEMTGRSLQSQRDDWYLDCTMSVIVHQKRAAAAKVRFLVNWLLLAASTRKNQLESIKLYDKWQIGGGVSTQLNSATLKRSRLKPYLSTSVLNFLLHQNYYVGIMRMYSAVDCRNFLMDYFSTS